MLLVTDAWIWGRLSDLYFPALSLGCCLKLIKKTGKQILFSLSPFSSSLPLSAPPFPFSPLYLLSSPSCLWLTCPAGIFRSQRFNFSTEVCLEGTEQRKGLFGISARATLDMQHAAIRASANYVWRFAGTKTEKHVCVCCM